MAKAVPAGPTPTQFLFAANPGAKSIAGFRINPDGSLAPVPGSPFASDEQPGRIAAISNTLIVTRRQSLALYLVDKESGSIRETEPVTLGPVSALAVDTRSATVYAAVGTQQFAFRVSNGVLRSVPLAGVFPQAVTGAPGLSSGSATHANQAIFDTTRQFVYALDNGTAEISAYRVLEGKVVPLAPASYPIGRGTSSIAIAAP